MFVYDFFYICYSNFLLEVTPEKNTWKKYTKIHDAVIIILFKKISVVLYIYNVCMWSKIATSGLDGVFQQVINLDNARYTPCPSSSSDDNQLHKTGGLPRIYLELNHLYIQ